MSDVPKMVERVSRAIERASYETAFREGSGDINVLRYDRARAAIEAMRPSITAVMASYLSPEYSIPECITARQISDDLQAMIDEALTTPADPD